jgi:hypothetical protein
MITDTQLEIIDSIVSGSGLPTICFTTHPDRDLLSDELLAEGYVSYAGLPFIKPRSSYERSMWLRRPDNRCVPELHALAVIKHGALRKGDQPYWLNKDWTDTRSDNVGLVLATTKPSSKYGVKSGTPEYYRLYNADPMNKARAREASVRYSASYRERMKLRKERIRAVTSGTAGARMTDAEFEEVIRTTNLSQPGKVQELMDLIMMRKVHQVVTRPDSAESAPEPTLLEPNDSNELDESSEDVT